MTVSDSLAPITDERCGVAGTIVAEECTPTVR